MAAQAGAAGTRQSRADVCGAEDEGVNGAANHEGAPCAAGAGPTDLDWVGRRDAGRGLEYGGGGGGGGGEWGGAHCRAGSAARPAIFQPTAHIAPPDPIEVSWPSSSRTWR